MWTRDLLKMNAKQVLRNNYWMALLVVVTVVSFGLILVMRQQRGAPTFGEFHRGIGIGFITVSTAGKEIGGEPVGFGQLGFLEFHIDLSRDGLIAVLHG